MVGTWTWLVLPELTGPHPATSTSLTVHLGAEGSLPRLPNDQSQDTRWEAWYELIQLSLSFRFMQGSLQGGNETKLSCLSHLLPHPFPLLGPPDYFSNCPGSGGFFEALWREGTFPVLRLEVYFLPWLLCL